RAGVITMRPQSARNARNTPTSRSQARARVGLSAFCDASLTPRASGGLDAKGLHPPVEVRVVLWRDDLDPRVDDVVRGHLQILLRPVHALGLRLVQELYRAEPELVRLLHHRELDPAR